MDTGDLAVTGNPDADRLLNRNGTALLIGMLLDQQIPISWAFTGPATLLDRLSHIEAGRIAALAPDDFVQVCCQKPAIHRFPAAMAKRIQELCGVIERDFDGNGANIWATVDSADQLVERLGALPGFGEEKVKIFVALLAKRFNVTPVGWQAAAGAFADEQPRSVADIDGPEAFALVRHWKKAQKAAGKDKQDRPL